MEDYKEKYEKVLKKVQELFKKGEENKYLTINAWSTEFDEIFPELRESEDERIRKEIICFLRNIPNSNYTCEEMAAWLEKQGEKSAEWSEEDENIFRDIVTRLHSHPDVDKTEYDKSYHWLKDLKDRYIWKPSDRQMEALWNVYQGGKEQAELAILYNDLKKLRNE